MLDDLRSALHRLDRQPDKAFSSEVGTGSREENASKRKARASALTTVRAETARNPN
jgi:hypothetical protein